MRRRLRRSLSRVKNELAAVSFLPFFIKVIYARKKPAVEIGVVDVAHVAGPLFARICTGTGRIQSSDPASLLLSGSKRWHSLTDGEHRLAALRDSAQDR